MSSTEPFLRPFIGDDGQERGWRFAVTRRGRPPVALQYGQRGPARDRFIAARLHVGPNVGFWGWVDDWWGQAAFVGPTHSAPCPVVPPISARLVQAPPDWTRWFFDRLVESESSPLYAGNWWIGPVTQSPTGRPRIADVVEPLGAAWWTDFEQRVLLTRQVADTRRVGFWRKQLEQGARPPLLLLYLSLFEVYAILDGHCRLRAARELGVELPQVVVSPFHTRRYPLDERVLRGMALQAERIDWAKASPALLDKFNRAVIRAHVTDDHYMRIRAWPLAGGWDRWRREIEGHVQRLPAEEAEHARDLLPP